MRPRTADRPDSVQQFQERALAVTASVLAVGSGVLTLVVAVTGEQASTLDVVLLATATIVHAVVAATVGRRWRPGGAPNVAYVLGITVLVVVAVLQARSPAVDTFWNLLVPVALAAITLSTRWQVTVTALGLVGYLAASAAGPGIAVGYAGQRCVALVLFAVFMWFLTRRLIEALEEADAARDALEADVAEATSENEALLRVDSARDDYVSSVSHELRTPLSVILGIARTLDTRWEDLDDATRRVFVRRLAASAGGLDGIVSALLDLARIERGGLDPVIEPVALDEAVPASVARLAPLLEQHQVTTQVARGTMAATDRRLLERVLDNLVTNAARHTPSGTTVTVAAADVGDAVRIEVRDDGPGIPPQDVAQLGQQFFRGGAEGDPAREGLGLGLSLVVELLDALDSQLEVTSEVGVGTVFAFSLPRSRRDAPPA